MRKISGSTAWVDIPKERTGKIIKTFSTSCSSNDSILNGIEEVFAEMQEVKRSQQFANACAQKRKCDEELEDNDTLVRNDSVQPFKIDLKDLDRNR